MRTQLQVAGAALDNSTYSLLGSSGDQWKRSDEDNEIILI